MVRYDRGTENSKLAFLQPFLRRNNCSDGLAGVASFQYGKSASNQTYFHKNYTNTSNARE